MWVLCTFKWNSTDDKWNNGIGLFLLAREDARLFGVDQGEPATRETRIICSGWLSVSAQWTLLRLIDGGFYGSKWWYRLSFTGDRESWCWSMRRTGSSWYEQSQRTFATFLKQINRMLTKRLFVCFCRVNLTTRCSPTTTFYSYQHCTADNYLSICTINETNRFG